MEPKHTYRLTIETSAHEAMPALRRLLKTLLRCYGFRVVTIAPADEDPKRAGQAFEPVVQADAPEIPF
ncbi:MAG: hypothetical protein AAGJ40_20450 [Planctomycetota bacterium]